MNGMGWMDGWDGDQKGPLIFFILRYIKHYTYTNFFFRGPINLKSLMVWMGWMGWDGTVHQKGPLIFFI